MLRKQTSAMLLAFIFNAAMLLMLFFASSAFAHSASIEISGENKYKAFRLAPEIYNNANSDLSDILIKNINGETVPYFFNSGIQTEHESRESYPMELINAYSKDDSFYFDYKIETKPQSDAIATSIEFTTNSTNFAKTVDVYGSYDNLLWEYVQNDKLYSVDGKSKLGIVFYESQKYTHYRFELANNMEKISFESVDLVYSINASEQSYFIEILTPEFNIEQKDKTTFIKIQGLKNLRLCDITIGTNSMFKRTATPQFASSKEIFNLSINGASYKDTTIPLDWQISKEDIYVVTIANNDDKPIDITGITVRYYVDEVVFEGNPNESYTLEFGADSEKTAPVYDIVKYKEEILKSPIDKANIGAINFEYDEEEPAEPDYKFIFNIVVIATAVLLGVLILRSLKHKKE